MPDRPCWCLHPAFYILRHLWLCPSAWHRLPAIQPVPGVEWNSAKLLKLLTTGRQMAVSKSKFRIDGRHWATHAVELPEGSCRQAWAPLTLAALPKRCFSPSVSGSQTVSSEGSLVKESSSWNVHPFLHVGTVAMQTYLSASGPSYQPVSA